MMMPPDALPDERSEAPPDAPPDPPPMMTPPDAPPEEVLGLPPVEGIVPHPARESTDINAMRAILDQSFDLFFSFFDHRGFDFITFGENQGILNTMHFQPFNQSHINL